MELTCVILCLEDWYNLWRPLENSVSGEDKTKTETIKIMVKSTTSRTMCTNKNLITPKNSLFFLIRWNKLEWPLEAVFKDASILMDSRVKTPQMYIRNNNVSSL